MTTTQPEPLPHQPTKSAFYKRHWVHVAAAALVGIGIGSAASGGSNTTAKTIGAAPQPTVTATVTAPAPPPNAGTAKTVTAAPVPVPTVTVTTRVTVTRKAAAAAVGASFGGEGTFLVGTDIRPGTYRAPAASSGNCYWERMRDLTGSMNSTIANDNTSGPVLITVKSTDKAVKVSGCSTFTRVG